MASQLGTQCPFLVDPQRYEEGWPVEGLLHYQCVNRRRAMRARRKKMNKAKAKVTHVSDDETATAQGSSRKRPVPDSEDDEPVSRTTRTSKAKGPGEGEFRRLSIVFVRADTLSSVRRS